MLFKSIGFLLIGLSHYCYDGGLWLIRKGKRK